MHQHHAGHQHQHQHHDMEKRQDVQGGTVVEYVYQTAAKTFDGPIGGYITAPATPDNSESNNNKNNDNNAAVASPTTTTTPTPSPTPTPTPTPISIPTPTPTPAKLEDIVADTTSTSTSASTSTTPTTTSTPTSTSSTSSTTSSTSSTPKKEVVQPASPSTTSSATSSMSTSSTSSFIEATSSSAKPTSTTVSEPSSNGGGMSGGAKAGLAIGILLAVALLLGLLFFCFRRRRKHANENYVKADDEKAAYMEGLKRSQSVASSRTTATAPRLSLRPITQFMPDMAARGKAMNGAAPAAALGAVGGAAAGTAASRDHNDPENPFGNHAEVSRKSQGSSEKEVGLPIQNNAAENPFGMNAEVLPQTNDPTTRSIPDGVVPAPLRIRTPTPEAGAVAGGAVAGAAGGLAAAQIAERRNAPKPLNLTPKRPVSPAASSPAVSEFSQTSVSAAAMVNGPPPSNVHRIQLDFKPSMDDELSLRAGQLVRLLHEYDDGWALCIRLDRSQQGVAPRTCLSARPVKPRPTPGARGPGPRGPPPGFMGPGQQRPQSPASGHGPPSPHAQGRAPRPYRPAGSQQRSMSPGPYGGGPQRPAQIPTPGSKRRSNSVSEVSSRRTSPLGPSGLNPNVQKVPMQLQAVTPPDQTLSQTTPRSTVARKPVPGQAM